MLGLQGGIQPGVQSGKALPVSFLPNMQVISIESLMGDNRDAATIWRGPLKIGVIRQFISDMEWSDLDYLVIDSPPGTGDEPLTIAQTIADAKALVVTTPQEISLADVRKSINFCRQVHMEILGLVENMSGFSCPHCGKSIDLFKAGGGRLMAEALGLRLLASLPIDPDVVKQGDAGKLADLFDRDSDFSGAFKEMVKAIEQPASTPKSVPQAAENNTEQGVKNMEEKTVFAIPVAEGKLCAHFGHCEQFALIETENGEIRAKTMETPPPHEPGVLPKWLHDQGAHVIIAGGMGARAQQLFVENGIKVVTGAPADAPEALVHQYLSNTLLTGENLCDH
jgi:predicted Fe-Mo cluster-binding NifX family protein